MVATPEPVLLAWSGGKDSLMALERLGADPAVEVVGLLTTVSRQYDRISIHGVRRSLLRAQAAALGLPVVEAALAERSSNQDYERAFAAALAPVRAAIPSLRRVAFGDLFLADIRRYREEQLRRLGLACLFPVWGAPTDRLARDFVTAGHQARIVCVDTARLPAGFAGRKFDAALLADLPAGVDPCGENGEFHTFVFAGPMFRERITVVPGETVVRDGFAYADLVPG